MTVLDARGLSCPEPVILLRQAMKTKDELYEIRVDNVTSRENVTRYAEHQGYHVTVREEAGDYVLLAQKP